MHRTRHVKRKLNASWALAVLMICSAGCVERQVGCAEIICGTDDTICVSPCERYEYRGGCYDKTTRCCSDVNCPVGTCDSLTGYCREYAVCACFDDDECPAGSICLTNHTVCGICVQPPTGCLQDVECATGEYCTADEYCQERCCP